jgi:hypothetical protein
MRAQMFRKTAILVSAILFSGALALSASIALAPRLTSAEAEITQNDADHAVASAKKVSSNQKRKRLVATLLTNDQERLLPVVENPDITPAHQKIADTVLRTLPSGCRDHLRNFYVQYNNPKNRGLGGKTTIILAGNVSDEEFAGLLIHECGHVIHSNMPGSPLAGKSTFVDGADPFYTDSPMVEFFAISWTEADLLKRDAKKTDFVSGYAMSDAFEDFAETFAMYILHRDAFEVRAKTNTAMAAKLEWMKTNLPMNENSLGTSRYVWEKTVPWDVTKLPFTLN